MNFKRDLFKNLLDKNWQVHVTARTSCKGVIIPHWLMDRDLVILSWGNNMSIPITDMRISDTTLSGNLSFSRQAFFCSVPWESVVNIEAPFQNIEYTFDGGAIAASGVLERALADLTPARSKRPNKPGLRLIKGGKS
jgi:hypothetical protein